MSNSLKDNKRYLERKNSHPRDDKIVFTEEGHLYDIEGLDKRPISVTTIIHDNFPKFDSDVVISKMMKSPKWSSSKYYGMTKYEIKKKWSDDGKDASSKGTLMHEDIERYFNKEEVLNPNSVEFSYFLKFWEEFQQVNPGFEPYRTEWLVYDKGVDEVSDESKDKSAVKEHDKGMDEVCDESKDKSADKEKDKEKDKENAVAGSIDFLLKDKYGRIVIVDWKRSKEIKEENKFEKGLGVFSHLDNCNFWHYSLQLNIYRHILETRYNKEVVGMYIAVFHPDNSSHITHLIPRYDISSIWGTLRRY